jgi:hypothetical protein
MKKNNHSLLFVASSSSCRKMMNKPIGRHHRHCHSPVPYRTKKFGCDTCSTRMRIDILLRCFGLLVIALFVTFTMMDVIIVVVQPIHAFTSMLTTKNNNNNKYNHNMMMKKGSTMMQGSSSSSASMSSIEMIIDTIRNRNSKRMDDPTFIQPNVRQGGIVEELCIDTAHNVWNGF